MYSPSFALRSLFLVILFLFGFSTSTLAQKGAYTAVQRLRVRVQSNTLRSGEATKVFVEFLDRNYQQVPNDVPRVIQLTQSTAGSRQTGSGQFSPSQIKIPRGASSGWTNFVSRQVGKLLIVATTPGLDSAQALVVITRPSASWLSSLLETVAYAQEEIEVLPPVVSGATANNTSPAWLTVSLSDRPAAPITVRVVTTPAARLIYQEREFNGFVHITLDEKQIAAEFGVISGVAQRVAIEAKVLPTGSHNSAQVNFVAPQPKKILFDPVAIPIPAYQRNILLSVQLGDGGGIAVDPDRERSINFSSGSDSEQISFDPPSVVLSPSQTSAQTRLKLKNLPEGNMLQIQAVGASGANLNPGLLDILFASPVEKLVLSGPHQVDRNGEIAQLTVRLTDKNETPVLSETTRTIDLSTDGGALDINQVVIKKGEDHKTIKFTSPSAVGRYTLTANSALLNEAKFTIDVVTPMYWLLIAALLGGAIGGVVRHMSSDFKLTKVKPEYKNGNLELGLLGHVGSSLVCGLVFFLVFKFGLSKAFGPAVLPASFEFGTRSVALLFGVIGGFAGTVVLDKLVGYFLPSKPKEAEKATQKRTAKHRSCEKADSIGSDSMEPFENVPPRKPKNNRAAMRAGGGR